MYRTLVVLLLLFFPALSVVADLTPGLLAKATDRELTVHFVAPVPSVVLRTNDSIHPQLKPNFTGEFSGYLLVSTTAQYTITGAPEIFVDGKNVSGQPATLPAGERRLRVPFQRARNEPFAVSLGWRVNGGPVGPIPASAFAHERPPRELAENQSRDLGRKLFEDFNCGACHSAGTAIIRFTVMTNAPVARALRALRPTDGCLSDAPEENVPKFSLNDSQREALQLFIQTPDISRAPLQDFPRLLTQLDCRACHSFQSPPNEQAPDLTDSFQKLNDAAFKAAIVSHQTGLMVTNLSSDDLQRLVDLFASQVATNRPSP